MSSSLFPGADRRRLRSLSQLRSFLLFVFYEIAIVPKYFLIAIWGSTRREYAAMKLALYSFVGSAMVLIGLLAAYATSGSHSTS
jgi:NADH-quinone oxidoreductase subunit M